MLYTVGKTALYERYFEEQEKPRKAIGGAVWYSRDAAEKYLEDTGQKKKFTVYGVLADWNDTEYTGEVYRSLKIEADLVKLD